MNNSILREVVRRAGKLFRVASLKTALSKWLDKLHNINTHGTASLEKYGLGSPERTHYAPGSWWTMRTISTFVEFEPDDVFVDFGSGKGRVVYLAARHYRFKKVIGVEIASELNAIARANIERNLKRLKCKDVALVTSDVLNFVIPNDMTIAFFYAPFTGKLFAQVLQAIREAYETHPRRLFIILQRPRSSPKSVIYDECDHLLRRSAFLECLASRVRGVNVTTLLVCEASVSIGRANR